MTYDWERGVDVRDVCREASRCLPGGMRVIGVVVVNEARGGAALIGMNHTGAEFADCWRDALYEAIAGIYK